VFADLDRGKYFLGIQIHAISELRYQNRKDLSDTYLFLNNENSLRKKSLFHFWLFVLFCSETRRSQKCSTFGSKSKGLGSGSMFWGRIQICGEKYYVDHCGPGSETLLTSPFCFPLHSTMFILSSRLRFGSGSALYLTAWSGSTTDFCGSDRGMSIFIHFVWARSRSGSAANFADPYHGSRWTLFWILIIPRTKTGEELQNKTKRGCGGGGVSR
jgi:hypothetical protein